MGTPSHSKPPVASSRHLLAVAVALILFLAGGGIALKKTEAKLKQELKLLEAEEAELGTSDKQTQKVLHTRIVEIRKFLAAKTTFEKVACAKAILQRKVWGTKRSTKKLPVQKATKQGDKKTKKTTKSHGGRRHARTRRR